MNFLLLVSWLSVGAAAAPDLSGVGALVDRSKAAGPAGRDYCVLAYVDTSPAPGAPAYAVGNAHCFAFFVDPARVRMRQPIRFPVRFDAAAGGPLWSEAMELAYGSMDGTDIALFRLMTDRDALARRGVRPLPLARAPARLGEPALRAQTPAETYSCSVAGAGLAVKEERYLYAASYKHYCESRHGSSGSPLVSLETGAVFAVHNSGRARKPGCGLHNACELDAWNRPLPPDNYAGFAQPVHVFTGCFDAAGVFEPALASCGLPRR